MSTPRTPQELDAQLRDTVAARGRELVPDSAVPPPLDLTRPVTGSPLSIPGTTPRRPAWWLTTGLAAAAAALLVVGTTALHASQTGAQRPAGPTPATSPTVTSTTTQAPTRTPDRSPTWTADPQPFTAPVRPTTAPAVAPPPATSVPTTTPVTPTTSAPAVAVGVYADCNQPPSGNPWVQRPTGISLACADAGEVLEDIAWTSWGPSGAVGRATVVLKTCTPDCATGGSTRSATTVSLSQVRPDGSGRPTFTVVRLSPDPIPTHLPEHPGSYVLQTHP